jgi:hypothetical protein
MGTETNIHVGYRQLRQTILTLASKIYNLT